MCIYTNGLYIHAGPPTDVAAELTSPTTIRVTRRSPIQGTTVTGYIIHYTDRDGEKTYTAVADSDELTIEHCGENVNISIAALSSQYLPSEPQIIHLTLRKIITGYVMSWLHIVIVFSLGYQ